MRSMVRSLGFKGYRLHRRDIPGTPDMAWIGRKVAIFIHGCFWHSHDCQEGLRKPKSNKQYWLNKIERNRKRDLEQKKELKAAGWRVLIIWECMIKNERILQNKLEKFLKQTSKSRLHCYQHQ